MLTVNVYHIRELSLTSRITSVRYIFERYLLTRVLEQQYTLHSGADSIKTYQDPTTLSGKPLGRAFCSTCGSKLHALTPLREDIISIPAGLLSSAHSGLGVLAKDSAVEGQAWGSWKPDKEQFCQEKAGWVPELGVVDSNESYVKGTMGEKAARSATGAKI